MRQYFFERGPIGLKYFTHVFSFFVVFYLASLPLNKTKGLPSSKITNVKIPRLFEIILEKQQTRKRGKWSFKGEWKEVAISYYKNAFVTGKHILKVYNTYKQNKGKFNTRKSNVTKSIPFTSNPKFSKDMKTSKQSVEALKKARSENVSESKQSHVEKPDIINTLEISEERDNENTLLTTNNCDGDHQPPLSKQKQFISPDKAFATNPSFEHFVGGVVSKVVVERGKKFYFNDSSKYKVNTADVTSANILKPS